MFDFGRRNLAEPVDRRADGSPGCRPVDPWWLTERRKDVHEIADVGPAYVACSPPRRVRWERPLWGQTGSRYRRRAEHDAVDALRARSPPCSPCRCCRTPLTAPLTPGRATSPPASRPPRRRRVRYAHSVARSPPLASRSGPRKTRPRHRRPPRRSLLRHRPAIPSPLLPLPRPVIPSLPLHQHRPAIPSPPRRRIPSPPPRRIPSRPRPRRRIPSRLLRPNRNLSL